ncbi:MAG: hypothetical protein V1645_02550, partial [archaeon]
LTYKLIHILKTVRTSGLSLLNTINSILDFARSEDGKLQLASVPFKLEETIKAMYFHLNTQYTQLMGEGFFPQNGAVKLDRLKNYKLRPAKKPFNFVRPIDLTIVPKDLFEKEVVFL